MKKLYVCEYFCFWNSFRKISIALFILCILPTINYSQSLTEISSSIGIGGGCTGMYGNGLSFYDWDSDGFDDVVLLDDTYSVRFYKNTNGLFEFVEMPGIEVTGAVKSVNWVDINNDKEPDIAFNLAPGTFKLFLNNGEFNFTDISETCGIEQITSMGYGQSWGDYDKDGFLDLYICNYQTDQIQPQRSNYLYHNNGDGTFTNTTQLAGVGNGFKTTFISVWMDYDKDSWPDLFVLNDRYQFANALYKNNGDGTFTDVSTISGFDGSYEPMSASVGDFNNDQNLDIYTTNTNGNKLFLNSGDGVFTDVAALNNAQMFVYSWGAIWMDIDGDLKEDLVVASAQVFGNYNNLYLLKNMGSGFETAQNYGFGASYGVNYAIAAGDINNDGKQEIISHGVNPSGTQVWTTNSFNYNYLKINLNGIISNREGTGAWIEAYTGDVTQTRYTLSGEQYLSQNSQWEFFGFGGINSIDSLIIRWPSGLVDKFYNLAMNQAMTIQEGETINCQIVALSGSFNACADDTVILDAGQWDSYYWQDGSIDRYLNVVDSGEYSVIVSTGGLDVYAQAVQVNFSSLDDFTLAIDEPLCNNSGNGSIMIYDAFNSPIQNVTWNNSEIATQYFAPANSNIQFSFLDSLGCEFFGQTIISQPELLDLDIHAFFNTDPGYCLNTWNGYVDVQGGVQPFSIEWDFFLGSSQTPFEQQYGPYYLCVENSEEIRIKCRVIDVNECVKESEISMQTQGVDELLHENVNRIIVNPNPFSTIINIKNLDSNTLIKVHDISGKIVLQQTLNESVCYMNLTDLNSGIYMLEICQESSTVFKRIIKN